MYQILPSLQRIANLQASTLACLDSYSAMLFPFGPEARFGELPVPKTYAEALQLAIWKSLNDFRVSLHGFGDSGMDQPQATASLIRKSLESLLHIEFLLHVSLEEVKPKVKEWVESWFEGNEESQSRNGGASFKDQVRAGDLRGPATIMATFLTGLPGLIQSDPGNHDQFLLAAEVNPEEALNSYKEWRVREGGPRLENDLRQARYWGKVINGMVKPGTDSTKSDEKEAGTCEVGVEEESTRTGKPAAWYSGTYTTATGARLEINGLRDIVRFLEETIDPDEATYEDTVDLWAQLSEDMHDGGLQIQFSKFFVGDLGVSTSLVAPALSYAQGQRFATIAARATALFGYIGTVVWPSPAQLEDLVSRIGSFLERDHLIDRMQAEIDLLRADQDQLMLVLRDVLASGEWARIVFPLHKAPQSYLKFHAQNLERPH